VTFGIRASIFRQSLDDEDHKDGNLPSDQLTIDHWFDLTAFATPAQYTFGNSEPESSSAPATSTSASAFTAIFPSRNA
jgi:hypothetical protein